MDKFEEKTISSKTVYKGKVFEVTTDEVELSNGMKTRRDVVVHPGGVVIYAQKEDKVLFVKQYRYPTKEVQIELPAGRLEIGEDPLLAAQRELREETGYIAENWESLGYIFTSFGICTEKLYLFKAENLTFDKPDPDEGEILDYFEISVNEMHKLIKDGTINDAKTLCATLRANL